MERSQYTVYSDDQCTQNARDAGLKNVVDGVVDDSDTLTFNSAGSFYWQAVYSGDDNNMGATSDCLDELLVVGKASPSIATSLSDTQITVGSSAHDTLHPDRRNVRTRVERSSYTVYSDDQCTQNARDAGPKNVTDGVVADSDTLTFNSAGSFYWQAVYSGDDNNMGATSDCLDELLVVGKASPSIATSLSDTQITVGGSAHDSSTLTDATSDAGGTVRTPSTRMTSARRTRVTLALKNVEDGVVDDSDTLTFNSAGSFYWQAVYSGDDNNIGRDQ